MALIEHVSVAVQDDFVARQTRAKPIPALAELIWNSLDADANRVDVELVYGGLIGGLSQIVVQDDGEGFSREDAKGLFGNLGGSWKRMTRRTKRGDRMIHGQEGRGRYKAFSLGGLATWKVCYAAKAGNRAFEIRIAESDLTDVIITPDEPAPGRRTGVIVVVDNLRREFRSFETDVGFQELAEIFALYLKSYRAVSISVGGHRIDPEKAIRTQAAMALPLIVAPDGTSHGAELQVIEWQSDTKRVLYLCSKDGFPLDQFETKFHVPGFSFSAYLRSTYIEHLQNESRLGLAELDPPLAELIERARSEIKDYFRNRAAEKARTVVDVWKAEEVYPYVGEPQTTVEKLVVELKAPRVKIGADEMNQIKKYAQAVRADERFSTVKGIRWHFWIVSNSYDEMAKYEIEGGPDPERRLIARTGDHSVGIKTWGEIIEENRARLQFFQEQMQHTVSESQAVEHLQEKYSRFLEGVFPNDEEVSSEAVHAADAEAVDVVANEEEVPR